MYSSNSLYACWVTVTSGINQNGQTLITSYFPSRLDTGLTDESTDMWSGGKTAGISPIWEEKGGENRKKHCTLNSFPRSKTNWAVWRSPQAASLSLSLLVEEASVLPSIKVEKPTTLQKFNEKTHNSGLKLAHWHNAPWHVVIFPSSSFLSSFCHGSRGTIKGLKPACPSQSWSNATLMHCVCENGHSEYVTVLPRSDTALPHLYGCWETVRVHAQTNYLLPQFPRLMWYMEGV